MVDEFGKLYTALIKRGYTEDEIGDENTFRGAMADKANRKELYDWVSERGDFGIGDYDVFEQRLSGSQPIDKSQYTFTADELGIEEKKPEERQSSMSMFQMGMAPITMGQAKEVQKFDIAPIKKEKPVVDEEQQKATSVQVGKLAAEVDSMLAKRSEEVLAEREAKENAKPWYQRMLENAPRGGGIGALPNSVKTNNDLLTDNDFMSLSAAKKSLDNAQNMIAEAEHNRAEGSFGAWLERSFAGGAVRGTGKKLFDPRTWDMGIVDAAESAALVNALDAYEKGEKLTDAQRALLDAKAVELATNAYFGSEVGLGFKAGQTTAEAIPFMLEMAVNPAAATGKGVASQLTRYALKKFAGKAAKKALAKGVGIAGRAVGDMAGAAVMSATTGMGNVTADALNRAAGDVKFAPNSEGAPVFAGVEKRKDLGTAFKEAYLATTIENYSEMVGEYFSPILEPVGKGVRKTLDYIHLGAVNKFMDDVAMSDIGRLVTDFEKHTKWNGVFGEYAEEVVGGMINAAVVGDQTFDTNKETGVFNLDRNIETLTSVALLGGFMSTVKTLGYRTPVYRAEQAVKRADENVARLLPDWEERKTELMGENPNLALINMLKDATPEQRKAILEYVAANANYEGVVRGKKKQEAEGATAENVSYDEGYNTTEPQDMNDAKLAMENARERVAGFIADEGILEYIENEPNKALNSLIGTNYHSDEEMQAVVDYINAKAKFNGMTQRINDDIDSRIAESDAVIDGQTRADGNIQMGKLDGRDVFVLTGTVEEKDGVIDSPDAHLIVLDNGERKMIAPGKLQEVLAPISAADEKARLAEEIRTTYNAEAENKINGVLAFKPGDVYEVVDKKGKKHTISVLNDLGETIEADVDGKTEELPKATVQAMVNDANKARVADPYALNKEVAVNVEGGTVNGVVTEPENEDGMITVQFTAPNGERVVQFTREELDGMQNGLSNTHQPASEPAQAVEIPMEGKGKNARPAYHLVPVERTLEELHNNELTPEEIAAFIDNNIAEAQGELRRAETGAPKMGTNIAEYKAAKAEWQKKKDAIQAKLDYYNELKNREAEAERSELKEIAEAPVDVIGDNISTPDELVSTYLGGIKITPESFKRETGLGNAEQQKLVGYIASKDKGGVSVERAAEIIYENYGHELAAAGFAGDVQGIRDMVISVLADGSPKTYAKRGAELRAKAEVDARREEIESFVKREFDMELDDYIAYEESVVPRIIQDYTGFDEQEYFNILANEYNNEVNYDTERESESAGRGGNVLQTEQSVDAAGIKPIGAGNEGGAIPSDVQGSSQDAVAQREEVTDKNGTSGDNVSPVEPFGISEQLPLQNENNGLSLQQENGQKSGEKRPRSKPRGFRSEVKKTTEELFAEEKEKTVNGVYSGDYAKVLAESNSIEEAISKFNDMADVALAQAEEWASRQYKKNNTVVTGQNSYSAVDEYETTISAANERRREANIKRLKTEAETLRGYANTLAERTNYSQTAEKRTAPTENEQNSGGSEKAGNQGEKIEDVGEVLAGARKDMLKVIASAFDNATMQSLIELPFAKAFKKPDLKKAVESGVLREGDALFYEAWFNTMINTSKPKLSRRVKSSDIEKWAQQNYDALQVLAKFIEADEQARDVLIAQMMKDKYPTREAELAVIEKRKEWNAASDTAWGDKTTPNPLWVMHEVLKRLGVKAGEKIDIPFGILKANTTGTGYELYNAKNERLVMQGVSSVEEGIDKIVWLAKLKRGDNVAHPMSAFNFKPTKSEMVDSGRYRVMWGSGLNAQDRVFNSKEEAEQFAATRKSKTNIFPVQIAGRYYGYKITFRNPLTGDVVLADETAFETKGEAEQFLQENYDAINEKINEELAKTKGESKKELSADDVLEVVWVRSDNAWKYAVNIKEKYSNNMGMPLMLREFDTRAEAVAYYGEVKEEIFQGVKKALEERKAFVYFDTGENSRIGEDYRGGKDVTAEDFMNEFGFRGVQFGNWTNQADRQMAVNQAYDAFLDLAKLIGVTPKALSLNGELGIAFGSRGSGKFAAHYEPGEIVINLTKTRGAGSLAHEWWHALDNYFARRADVPGGMVTDSKNLAMREELREAYNALLRKVENSDYMKRSVSQGDYWGRMHEVTARLLAEWVDQSLKKNDEVNTFLSRGVNEDKYKRMNYEGYAFAMKTIGKEPMPYEEFAKSDKALAGFPYPTKEEVQEFGDAMRNVFDVMQEEITDDGKVALFSIAEDYMAADMGTVAFERATKRTKEQLESIGIPVHIATEEQANMVLELAEMQKRTAPETVSVQDEHLQTVVSSADGAKVLKDLDSAIKEYENDVKTKEKTFLGKLAEILNAKKHGSNSQYATFEAVNGKVFTIRLANHNAKVSTFDNHNEDEGISIVVTAQENNGVTNDGKAHLVEFYYDAIKLRKADGKPLVEILKSIKQALYSGEYKDNTGLAQVEEVNIPEMMTVYHGSGAKFDKFDHSFMGTGEGAQAFGWGTYVTEVEGIGRTYANASGNLFKGGFGDFYLKKIRDGLAEGKGFEEIKQNLLDRDSYLYEKVGGSKTDDMYFIHDYEKLQSLKEEDLPTRNLYTVEIPEDNGSNYLQWDKRGDAERQERVLNGLMKIGFEIEPDGNHITLTRAADMIVLNINATGAELYTELSEGLGGDKQASEFLNDIGFVGISYPAEAMSGGRADKAKNYVIFNESDAQITDRIEFFRTANGTIYGWAVNGEIYLTPDGMNPNTPVHEYTHLWASAVEKNNPELWARIVEGLKASPVWNEVLADENYRDIKGNENRVASEVLSRLSGRENYNREMARAEAEINAANGVIEVAEKISAWERVKRAVSDFWNKVKSLMGLPVKGEPKSDVPSWMEFVEMPLNDFWAGVKPDAKGSPLDRMFVGEQGAANLDKAQEATTRLDNLNVAREMESAGKDAKAIKLATGWERGADGKWRYEVMDMIDVAAAEKLARAANSKGVLSMGVNTYLKYILKPGNEILKAYPRLADVKVVFKQMKAYGGYYDEENNTLAINSNILRKEEEVAESLEKAKNSLERWETMDDAGKELAKLMDVDYNVELEKLKKQVSELEQVQRETPTLIADELAGVAVHEIQHAIQGIEGFAKGGNEESKNEYLGKKLPLDHAVAYGIIRRMEEPSLQKLKDYMNSDDVYAYEANSIRELLKDIENGKFTFEDVLLTKVSPYAFYRRLAGEVESRNAHRRHNMTEEERRNTLAEETAMKDVAREDQIFIFDNLGESAMGSRVDARMAEIADYFKDKDLNPQQQVVVDVFSGKADNLPIVANPQEADTRRVIMRQGNEMGAGAKHSLFGHYNTSKGVISAEDIVLIPDVIALGERTEEKRGNVKLAVYRLKDDGGTRFTVVTEIKEKGEVFNDFYTNKKALNQTPKMPNGDTQSARTNDLNASADKGSANSSNMQQGEATAETINREGGAWHDHSYGLWQAVPVEEIPQREPDYVSRNYYGEKSSKYWYGEDEGGEYIIRASDHWSRELYGERADKEAERFMNDAEYRRKSTPIRDSRWALDFRKAGNFEYIPYERFAKNGEMYGKIYIKDLNFSFNTPASLVDRWSNRVAELAEKLHLDNVEVVTDNTQLDGKNKSAKGWFDPKTGKITIVLNNHADMRDVEQTLLHEAVAHYGLRALFGKDFDTFLDNVYNNVDAGIRAEIDALANEKYNGNKRVATEEYLAGLAERTNFENAERSSWWQQVKDFFMDMLAKAGVKLEKPLTDNELRYMLWRSYKNLAEGGTRNLIEEAIDIAKQNELGVGNYYREETPATGLARELYDKAVRVSTTDNNVKWNENVPYRLLESYQDSMLALKKFQEAVLAETGNEIRGFENAYIAENQMSSKNKAEQEIYERDFYNPLLAEINSLMKGGASYDDIMTYLFAKHGLERNVYMRAAAAKNKALEEMGEKPAVPKETDADYEEKMDAVSKWESEYEKKVAEYEKKYRNRDFSGLTELTGETRKYTAAAQKIVDEFEGEHNTKSLWEAINKATKESLRKSYESGLMSKDMYDKVSSMYKYYIPLRGWNAETAEDVYEYMTSNKVKLSPALKTAKGRRSVADDPIANIGFMAISSIVQGNRNLMKQRFLNFVLNNPTSLATVSNQWYVKNNVSGEWEPSLPQIPENATADEVNEIVKKHSERMELLKSFDLATQERGGLEVGKPIKQDQVPEHIVRVKRAGKEYCIYINGSPRAAQAVNGLTNPDSSNNALYKGAQVVKNFMARMFTSQNPAFIVTNLSRDIMWAGTAVAIKENADYTGRYTANIAAILTGAQLPRLIYKWKNGTLDMNVPEERYFAEFIKNGGETGFTQINTVEDFKRNIERSIKDANSGVLSPKKAARSVLDGIEFLNRSAEDTTRFAVYMTSRQMGRDVQQSVNDAKEVTVNFNKKGSGGLLAKELNFAYIFFNASIQSAANFGKLLKHHPKKTMAAVSAFAMSGFLAPMLAVALQSMFGDDDEYWDLPEWVRRNNIVLWVPGGYITIPLPHELRPFYAMGELAFSTLMGKEEPADAIMKAGEGFLNLLPLDFTGNGGNLAISLTPTILQPIEQLKANTDYFGVPIYKKNDFNESNPEWTKAYKGTATWLVDGTKWLNEVTGGDNVKSGVIDLNPAQIEHIFESYFGGVGKTINRTAKTVSMLWDEDMREWRNVPVVSSFYQQGGERTKNRQANERYYELMDEYKETERQLREYKKEARINPIEYAEKLKELMESPVYKRYVKMKGYKKAVEKYNKYIRDNDASLSDDKREDLETKILDFKTRMFEELEKLEEN